MFSFLVTVAFAFAVVVISVRGDGIGVDAPRKQRRVDEQLRKGVRWTMNAVPRYLHHDGLAPGHLVDVLLEAILEGRIGARLEKQPDNVDLVLVNGQVKRSVPLTIALVHVGAQLQ